jgi:hypothetical protein
MSYDLIFWEQGDATVPTPSLVYRALVDGDHVDGVNDLDIGTLLAAIVERFPAAVREPNGGSEWLVWEDGTRASFQVEWSKQHILVACRGTTRDQMNRLIDIAVDHGCALYDPQADERFA